MSNVVYLNSNGGYRATDCPLCGQEVRIDQSGDKIRFTCRGGCRDEELRPLLAGREIVVGTAGNGKPSSPVSPISRPLAVDGAELLAEIKAFIAKYMVLPVR